MKRKSEQNLFPYLFCRLDKKNQSQRKKSQNKKVDYWEGQKSAEFSLGRKKENFNRGPTCSWHQIVAKTTAKLSYILNPKNAKTCKNYMKMCNTLGYCSTPPRSGAVPGW